MLEVIASLEVITAFGVITSCKMLRLKKTNTFVLCSA